MKKYHCYNCKKEVELTISSETEEWITISSEPHEPCGSKYVVHKMISKDPEVIKMNKKFLGSFTDKGLS